MPRDVLNADNPDKDYGIVVNKETLQRNINMVIIGHVDSGKSTLMGQILHKLGQIKQHDINKMEKVTH